MPKVNRNDVSNYWLALPPLEEQIKIIAHLSLISDRIQNAIDIQFKQIEKLKEYKTSLINSAVTGKIKVPEVA